MYADKDKQRATTRDRVRRYRALQKGVTSEVGVTVIPKAIKLVEDIPKLTIPKVSSRVSHHPTCRCLMCGGK